MIILSLSFKANLAGGGGEKTDEGKCPDTTVRGELSVETHIPEPKRWNSVQSAGPGKLHAQPNNSICSHKSASGIPSREHGRATLENPHL